MRTPSHRLVLIPARATEALPGVEAAREGLEVLAQHGWGDGDRRRVQWESSAKFPRWDPVKAKLVGEGSCAANIPQKIGPIGILLG